MSTPVKIERLAIYLQPGQLHVSKEPCAVTTILGSCVAVCLIDTVRKIGGINHFLLPYGEGGKSSSVRFGDLAIRSLLQQIFGFGGHRGDLQAKVFGGACVLDHPPKAEVHLGMKNVMAAEKLLTEENIPIVAKDVGGQRGRKLIFHTDDGAAWVKTL